VVEKAIWLEAALNGPWARALQPRMPITVGELIGDGIACAKAGAAIVHVHAYDERTGRQRDSYEIYAPIIERIRARADVVCCPTIPFAGGPDAGEPMTPAERFAAVERLLEAGLIEWSVVDPGSVTIALADDVAAGRDGFVYANPESHVRYGLGLAAAHGMTPSYAIYEPGFLRLGAALHRATPGVPQPVYRFMFTEMFRFGFPPAGWALEAYLRLLRDEAPGAPWMVAGLGVEIEPLVGAAVRAGGHVRVGLEDAPLGTGVGNLVRVERAARLITEAGGDLASASTVRAACRT
jgi:3-keto-5-aminohexanoate cleavage enzyme